MCWRAGPRAELVLTPGLASGTCLPPRCHDVNGPGRRQRGTEAPSNGLTATLANPSYTPFANLQPRNWHNASVDLETRYLALGTVHAYGLWRFCGHRVSNACAGGPGQGQSRFWPLTWHQAQACPPHVAMLRDRAMGEEALKRKETGWPAHSSNPAGTMLSARCPPLVC